MNRLAKPHPGLYESHRQYARDFAIRAEQVVTGAKVFASDPESMAREMARAQALATLALYWQGEAQAEALLQIETILNATGG